MVAWNRMIDEHTYWCGVIQPGWRMDEGWETYVPILAQTNKVSWCRDGCFFQLISRAVFVKSDIHLIFDIQARQSHHGGAGFSYGGAPEAQLQSWIVNHITTSDQALASATESDAGPGEETGADKG